MISPMSADALLATKLLVPAVLSDWVTRARLVAHLSDGLRAGRQLTLVCAPAGFGKTTLIQEWVGAAEQSVGWLTLDEADNDPGRFVRYLAAAVEQATAGFGQVWPDGTVPSPPHEGLIALINELT